MHQVAFAFVNKAIAILLLDIPAHNAALVAQYVVVNGHLDVHVCVDASRLAVESLVFSLSYYTTIQSRAFLARFY